jgi:hypothetical protein
MLWIQIADPNSHTLYHCNVPQKACELLTWKDSFKLPTQPSRFKSGELANSKGNIVHEDLGGDAIAGTTVHHYRDTTTLNVVYLAMISRW